MIHLELAELMHVAERVLGAPPAVRDAGLLAAALARPQATVFGRDAYPGLDEKVAALLHSLTRNHALVDGNERLALGAVIACYGLNGRRLTCSNDDAHHLLVAVAVGELDEVHAIAARLSSMTTPRA